MVQSQNAILVYKGYEYAMTFWQYGACALYREHEAPIVDKMFKLFTPKQRTSHFSKFKECTSYLQVHANYSCISSRLSSESVCMHMSRSLKLEAALFLSVKGLQHKSPAVHEQ